MKRMIRMILKSLVMIVLILGAAATWVYLEIWYPCRMIARTDWKQGDYASHKKIRDACHTLLRYPYLFGGYHHLYASKNVERVGNKDSIPILIRAGKRQTRICRMMPENHQMLEFSGCYLGALYTLTAMPLGNRFSSTEIPLEDEYEIWERWWNETGRHLPFDEERGQLMLQENLNATIRVRVVDEEGEPISGVHASVYNTFSTRSDYKPGLTDADGVHEVRLYNIYRIGSAFKKEGYYTSIGDLWEAPEWGIPPANTKFTVVMKRITEPLPPSLHEPVGPFVFKADD